MTITIKTLQQLIRLIVITGCLSSCMEYQPPFNNFQPDKFDLGDSNACEKPTFHSRAERNTIARTTIRHLASHAVQFIQRGDRMTLIVPTDRYYLFNSPDFDDTEFVTLNNIAKLVRLFPCSKIIVAGFSDNIGKHSLQDRLSKARAETMLTFLWAKGVPAQRLTAEGFGEHFPVGNNQIIHGSAYNRRIEIQWWTGKAPPPIPEHLKTK
ncbi:MAG: OmpA family protein [Legionellaceae bacterium]|nr:OmpA family protein [Legionellaceae bacterium]